MLSFDSLLWFSMFSYPFTLSSNQNTIRILKTPHVRLQATMSRVFTRWWRHTLPSWSTACTGKAYRLICRIVLFNGETNYLSLRTYAYNSNLLLYRFFLFRCCFAGSRDARFPRLLTTAQMQALADSDTNGAKLRLRAIADISCDLGGSLEFCTKTTTFEQPYYEWNPGAAEQSPKVEKWRVWGHAFRVRETPTALIPKKEADWGACIPCKRQRHYTCVDSEQLLVGEKNFKRQFSRSCRSRKKIIFFLYTHHPGGQRAWRRSRERRRHFAVGAAPRRH